MLLSIRICWLNSILSGILLCCDSSQNAKEFQIWAGLGQKAKLPCPTSPEYVNEVPILTLWFKGSIKEAIYSFDSRHKKFPSGEQWSDDVVLGRRASFVASTDPPTLVIQHVTKKDDDSYLCRVNYLKSPSNYVKVNLSVIVPPKPPMILWQDEEVVGEAGPFLEGERVDLKCQAKGGYPRPTVTWWRQGRYIKATEEWTEVGGEIVSTAHLVLTASRSLHKTPLICHARANHPDHSLSRPLTTALTLSITLPPLSVEITNIEETISAGTTIKPTCVAIGSHPPSEISWWKGGRRLTHVSRSVREGGNVSTATVTLRPTHLEHGSNLTCKAVNPSLIGPERADSVMLNIVFPPLVRLKLGPSINSSTLREGHDAFFECDVSANPPQHRLEWFFNGKPIPQRGFIISGESLVLQKLKRDQSGSYSCAATNLQGRNISQEIFLDIKYSPVCASDTVQRTQGAAMGRTSSILCHVESNPSTKVVFTWTRLLPSGREKRIDSANITYEGTTSRLSVTPTHLDDFGQYLCRARNGIGLQELPCRVILVTAGPPEPPGNCSANPLSKTLFIACREGFHGGFPQKFRLKAWQKNSLVANITSDFPEWSLENLNTEESLKLKLESFNAKGVSQPVHFHLHSPVAHQQATTVSRDSHNDMSLVAGIVMGVLIALLFILLAILLFIHKKKDVFSKRSNRPAGDRSHPSVRSPSNANESGPLVSAGVPQNPSSPPEHEHQQYLKKEKIDNSLDRQSISSSDSCCSSQMTVLAASTSQFKPATSPNLPSHLSGSVPSSLASYNRKEGFYSRNYKYRQKRQMEDMKYSSCGEALSSDASRDCNSQVCDCLSEDEHYPLSSEQIAASETYRHQCFPEGVHNLLSEGEDIKKRDSFHLIDYACTPKPSRTLTTQQSAMTPVSFQELQESERATYNQTLPADLLTNGDAMKSKFITKPKNSSQRESTV